MIFIQMVNFIKQQRIFLSVFFAFSAEIAMLSFWRGNFGSHKSAVVFFLASMTIGFLGLWLSFQKSNLSHSLLVFPPNKRVKGRSRRTTYVYIFLIAIFCFIAYRLLSSIFESSPIQAEQSDIIPQTQVLTQRFLQHQFPYQTIPFKGYDLFPTYQPLQWMPFTIAEKTDMDYRKLALVLLLLAIMASAFFLRNKDLSGQQLLCLGVLPFLPILMIAVFEPSIYERTLENLIAAYYFTLCIALFSRSVLFVGLALICCLLSRYSIILWVPLFLFMLYCSGERKKAAGLVLICTIGIVLIYILPFFSHDNTIFLKGYNYHAKAALGEWQGQWWQQPNQKPFQLFRGIGFAGMFYDYYKGSLEEKLKAFQLLHLSLSAATCILLGIFFWFKRHSVSFVIFALASLKIYLSVFYHFIQIPYDYLYMTLIYTSIPILWLSIKPKMREIQNR